MAMIESTFSKLGPGPDMQGKQGGFVQRDEITQRNHQSQCCWACKRLTGRAAMHPGWNALSAGITPCCMMREGWYQYLLTHTNRLKRKRIWLKTFGLKPTAVFLQVQFI
jgi:hypothetical protein